HEGGADQCDPHLRLQLHGRSVGGCAIDVVGRAADSPSSLRRIGAHPPNGGCARTSFGRRLPWPIGNAMRRTLLLLALLRIACFAAANSPAETPVSPQVPQTVGDAWAGPQIQSVLAAGIFDATPATFRPSDPLTWGELADVLGRWGKGILPPPDPGRLVTV